MGPLPQFPQYEIEIMLFPYLLLKVVKKMNELIIIRKEVCKHKALCYYVFLIRTVKMFLCYGSGKCCEGKIYDLFCDLFFFVELE